MLGNFGLDDDTDPVVATVRPEVTRFLEEEQPELQEPAVIALLETLGQLSADEIASLEAWRRPVLRTFDWPLMLLRSVR